MRLPLGARRGFREPGYGGGFRGARPAPSPPPRTRLLDRLSEVRRRGLAGGLLGAPRAARPAGGDPGRPCRRAGGLLCGGAGGRALPLGGRGGVLGTPRRHVARRLSVPPGTWPCRRGRVSSPGSRKRRRAKSSIGCAVVPRRARSASTSPTTLANLNPCPENPQATMTLSWAG